MRRILGLIVLCGLMMLPVASVEAAPNKCTGTIHIVQSGENLFRISLRYNVTMAALSRANGIVNPNHVYVGQRLVIPCGYTPPPAPPPAPSGKVHVVQPGESLSIIAAHYGVNMWAIARANDITNPNHVYVGQRLVIPGVAPQPKPKPTAAPSPPSSGSTGTWHGEYYAGTEPDDGPVFTKNSSALNFHWGLGSPDPRLCCDEFSARWSRRFNFRGGVYRFVLTVDDGARVWVDERLVLDAWEIQPETEHTFDVLIAPGYHTITIEYFEAENLATLQFYFKRVGNAPAPEPAPPGGDAHWQAAYYANAELADPAVTTIQQAQISADWGAGAPLEGVPADNFSVRWTRAVGFQGRTYTFCAQADDGVRIFLDDQPVLDEWKISDGSVTTCRDVPVSAAVHNVRVEYFEATGKAKIKVWWEPK